MSTIPCRVLSIGALAFLTLTGGAAAQTRSSAVLNALEVRTLVASADPGDNARLSAHFFALAERYTAEAREHSAMARAFIESPSVRIRARSSSDHCKRLANLATQSAATVRELAAHHDRLAAGIPSTAPDNSARFEAGEGARVAWEHEKAIHDLAANARTAADHRAIEEYFDSIEKQYSRAVNEHVAMAQAYRAVPNRRGGDPAAHCDRLVTLSRDAAKEAHAAAAEHKELAGLAR